MIEIARTRIGILTYLAPIGSLIEEDEASNLKEIIDSCIKSREINLIIDLAQVPTVNGIIIETLLDVQEKLAQIGGDIKVVNANKLIKDIFLISGFHDYVAKIDDY